MTDQNVVDNENVQGSVELEDQKLSGECKKLDPASFYKQGMMSLADYISNSFKSFIDLVDLKQETKPYSDFQSMIDKQYYVVELEVNGVSFLFLMDLLLSCRLADKLIGGTGEVVSEVPEKLSFSVEFLVKKFADVLASQFRLQGYQIVTKKSELDLKYFKLFFSDDQVLTVSTQIKYDDEDVGQLFICHKDTFFEDILVHKETSS